MLPHSRLPRRRRTPLPPMAATTLAWRWVIEALADAKEADAYILAGLIRSNVDVLRDSNINERVSLRILEELLDSNRGKSADGVDDGGGAETTCVVSMEKGPTGAIDVASRSEDVLCQYLRKVETVTKWSNPADASYKNELHHFIHQKRATFPKNSLEMLEAGIDKTCNEPSSLLMRNPDLTKEIQVDEVNDDMSKDALMLLELSNYCDKTATSSVPVSKDMHLENVLPEFQCRCTETHDQAECKRNPVFSDEDVTVQNGSNMVKENLKHASVQINVSDQEGCDRTSEDEDVTHGPTSVCDSFHDIIASEKCRLVDSQDPNNHDSSTGYGTQQQLCIKCDEPGQLLLCGAGGCPIAVHERCLGFTASCENTGEFYCPFCSYIQAATCYCNARKKVSICRKNLSSFMGWDPLHKRSVVQWKPVASKEASNPEEDAEECYHVKVAEQKQMTETVNDVSEKKCQKENEKESVIFHENGAATRVLNDLETVLQEDIPKCQKKQCTDMTMLSRRSIIYDGMKSSVDSHDDQCKMFEQKQLGDAALVIKGDNLPCHESDATPTRVVDCNSNHIEEDLLQSKGHERCNRDVPCKEKVGSSLDKNVNSIEPNPQISDQDACLISVNEKHSSYKKHQKPLKRQKRYANPMYPFSRRNRLLWTTEEEEMLKEAVQKFSHTASGCLPWTQILEYGHHVFHKTRQPADLKDKWRNIRSKQRQN